MTTVDRKNFPKSMGSVSQENTKPEIKLRKALHELGFHYRPHDKMPPGWHTGFGFSKIQRIYFGLWSLFGPI